MVLEAEAGPVYTLLLCMRCFIFAHGCGTFSCTRFLIDQYISRQYSYLELGGFINSEELCIVASYLPLHYPLN